MQLRLSEKLAAQLFVTSLTSRFEAALRRASAAYGLGIDELPAWQPRSRLSVLFIAIFRVTRCNANQLGVLCRVAASCQQHRARIFSRVIARLEIWRGSSLTMRAKYTSAGLVLHVMMEAWILLP